jgi:CHAT domain-containing protein
VLADPVFDARDPRVKLAGARLVAAGAKQKAPLREFERPFRDFGLVDERGELSRLPFSREEAEAIVAAAPAGSGLEALDFRASREAAMSAELSQYRVVHFATHGLLDSERPALSGLVFSLVDERGGMRNGFLRLHDVYNLDLPAELVVLSACQTGLGKEIRGEGLVGLARGFMYAGAQRVMASLWKVDDSATAEMMAHFYRDMFATKKSPAAALRAAQAEMLKQKRWRAPYYWAGFVLQGEYR